MTTLLTTAPTLADIKAATEASAALSKERAKRIAGDVAIVAGWLKRQPEDLPARIKDINGLISKLTPKGIGISKGRFRNIVSNLRRGFECLRAGAPRVQTKPVEQLSPAWAQLYAQVKGGWRAPALSPLMRYADANGIAPDAMSNEVVADCLAYRQTNPQSLARDPEKALQKACSAWNKAAEDIPGWPQARLGLPPRRIRVTFDRSAFPEALQRELEAFETNARDPRFGEVKGRRGRYRHLVKVADDWKPLSPRSIKERINALLLSASTLAHAGEVEIEEITSIAQIVTADAAGLVAETIEDRTGTKTEYPHTVVKHLRNVAGRCGLLSADERKTFGLMLTELKRGLPDGLTPKNRKRLAQFDDPAAIQRLISLPRLVMDELERIRRKAVQAKETETVTRDMALDALVAIAVLLLTTLPVRRGNLIAMEMEKHLRFSLRKQAPGVMAFEGHEVKNNRPLSAGLAPWKVRLIKLYLRYYRPLLCERGNPYLFPAAAGMGHKGGENFSAVVCDRIRERAGVEMNLHLFRHLMGTILLQQNPENTAIVERLLGQVAGSRSTRRYAELASRWASAYADGVLDALRQAPSPRKVA